VPEPLDSDRGRKQGQPQQAGKKRATCIHRGMGAGQQQQQPGRGGQPGSEVRDAPEDRQGERERGRDRKGKGRQRGQRCQKSQRHGGRVDGKVGGIRVFCGIVSQSFGEVHG
jgi:hypothetical protein